jgi:hypothetical protein
MHSVAYRHGNGEGAKYMRWQFSLPAVLLAIVLFIAGILLGSRLETSDPVHSSAAERLQPVGSTSGELTSATVYVPIYSSLYLGGDKKPPMVELAATVSVRNVSSVHPIVIEWVRYYDSTGKRVRDYLQTPASLPPLGSVEFVIQRSDSAGGPGANFLVRWKGPAAVDQPLIEAVMLGESGNAGISFTSHGRVIKSEPGSQQ